MPITSHLLCSFFIFWFFLFHLFSNPIFSATPILLESDPNLYKSALLMEPTTKTLLHEDRIHDLAIPASIVKMMVSLIAMEYLAEGKVKLEDKVTVSRWASRIGGHQVYLKQGEVFEFRELMKAVVIGSANDAAVAVAEFIGGSQDSFVDLMNQRAQELKMENTIYHNPHGLPPGKNQKENRTTAYDQALLAIEILKHPQYLVWSSILRDSFRNGTFELLNTNRTILTKMSEVDGLKTGYYRSAGFSVVASAKKEKTRLIAIVLGSKKKSTRTQVAIRLLKKGFNQYELVRILEKGTRLGKPVMIQNGLHDQVELLVEEDVELFLKRSDIKRIKHHFTLPDSLPAPINEGTIVGTVALQVEDLLLKEVNLLSARAIPAKTWWQKVQGTFKF